MKKTFNTFIILVIALTMLSPAYAVSLNGRGISDEGRSEPQYVGTTGYVAVYALQTHDIENTDKFSNTPWLVPTYTKSGAEYTESGTIDHKTQVKVVSQDLDHRGHGFYDGFLLIESAESGEQSYINVINYISDPYWEYEIEDAARVGDYIAEYHQKSSYTPVDRGNEPVELKDSFQVVVCGTTGTFGRGGPDNNTHQVCAKVYKKWKYGYGAVDCYFNVEDLTIIY